MKIWDKTLGDHLARQAANRFSGKKMSKKTELQAALIAASHRHGGSHGSIAARDGHMRDFVNHLATRGVRLDSIESIGKRHLDSYVAAIQKTDSARTIQNKISSLRRVLLVSGREKFVGEQLGSRRLGLEQGSRDGTKRPMTRSLYEKFSAAAAQRERGFAEALALCRHLGLRSMEAIRSPGSLQSWLRAIDRPNGHLVVHTGTKGDRPRTLPVMLIPDLVAARGAILAAIVASEANGGHLIARGTLAQAERRFHNEASAIGMKGQDSPHSLRYAFAAASMMNLVGDGMSEREALGVVSELLGHGDQRGRWVRQVYLRGLEEDFEP